MDLEQSAFEALRFASAQSLKLYKQPLVITYSGGKDSDVLLRLAINSGIPFEALHSLTTADAPETVYHVRDTFRRLEEKGVKVRYRRARPAGREARYHVESDPPEAHAADTSCPLLLRDSQRGRRERSVYRHRRSVGRISKAKITRFDRSTEQRR